MCSAPRALLGKSRAACGQVLCKRRSRAPTGAGLLGKFSIYSLKFP